MLNQLCLKSGSIRLSAECFRSTICRKQIGFSFRNENRFKEANETLYWLIFVKKWKISSYIIETLDELNETMAILSKIIITSKKGFTQISQNSHHSHTPHTLILLNYLWISDV